MKKYQAIEKTTEKKYEQKDKRKAPKMHISGKSVFKLQELIRKPKTEKQKKKS